MFKFLRTVAEALGRAGLKVMTNGVRADWLFCGYGFKTSWREMLWFISLFRRRRLYPRNARKFISSQQCLLKKWSVEQMRCKCKERLNGMVCLVWAGWQELFRRY